MTVQQIPDYIPKDFFEYFLKPILDIDPVNDEANKKFKALISEIIETKLEDYFQVIKKDLDYLLDQENKKKILEFLYDSCPPQNHRYLTSFKRLIAEICQQFIHSNPNYDKLSELNDISIEFWANHFNFYSIKLYLRKGSLSRLMDNIKYILETLVGFGDIFKASMGGLGAEYHKNSEIRALFNEEVSISIFFNQNNTKIFDYNNIYILFWSRGNKLKLWDDISLSTIDMIIEFLVEFLEFPNLEIININQSSYFTKSDLPKAIFETLEEISKKKTPLRFNRIIERDIKFDEKTYQEVIFEINGAYRHYYFTSMYILIRKLFENLLIDCLRNYYQVQKIETYFSTERKQFHGFELLKSNFNTMIQETLFISKIGIVHQKLIDLLDKFKDLGNIHAHSLFSLSHQSIIEDNKNEINILIKRLNEIRKNLI